MSTRCRRATATSVVVTVLACGALGAQEAPQVLHDPVDCLVVGKFPSIRACLAPAEEIARGRVYFQPEGLRAWYYVEMSRVDACWAGVLPKPTAQLVGRHVRYYLEALTRAVSSARTPDHDALVVRSEQECRGLVAPWAAAGPRAVFPTLPDGFLLASKGISPLLVAGAGIAVAGTALLVTGGSSAPPATSTPATSTLSPSPTPSPMPSPTPAPSPSPSPTPTPSPTPPAGGPLGVTCAADPPGGPAPLSVRFASTAQGGSGGYVFSWDFGDGTSASQRNPVHVYTAPGRYDPMVRVTSGAEAATCGVVVDVAPAPVQTFPLSVTLQGQGSGTVTSSPGGIDCGGTCQATYPSGTSVTLTASPASDSVFAGWSGACSGTGGCTVTMDAGRAVTARFDLRTYTLTVRKTPIGLILGSVTSSPGGIACGILCSTASAGFAAGTVVTLHATAIVTALFRGWSGACSGSGDCVVTMDADKTATADFSLLGTVAPVEPPSPVRGTGLRVRLVAPAGARGEVRLDGRLVLLAGPGFSTMSFPPGEHLVEGTLSGAAGSWSFELEPESAARLRPVAGDPVSATPTGLMFRLRGHSGERIAFSVEVPPDAASGAP